MCIRDRIIDNEYITPFVRATERAAYGASLFKGKNDKIAADKAAVDETIPLIPIPASVNPRCNECEFNNTCKYSQDIKKNN